MNFFFFFLFISLFFFYQIYTQTCIWNTENHSYNLTSLRKSNGNFQYYNLNDDILFELNLCGGLNTISQTICPCCTLYSQLTGYTMTQNYSCTAWGDFVNGESWDYIDGDNPGMGITLTYKTLTIHGQINRSMSYNFFCNDEEVFRLISAFIEDTIPPQIHINVASKFSCLEPTSSPQPSPTTDPGLCKTITQNELYDLRKLKGQYLYRDYWTQNLYFVSICENVFNISNCPCCVENTTTGWLLKSDGNCTKLGLLNTSLYTPLPGSETPEDGVGLNYQYILTNGTVTHEQKYQFICDIDANPGYILSIIDLAINPPSTEITFVTSHSCPLDPFSPFPTPSPCPKWSPCAETNCPTPSLLTSSSTTGMKGSYVFLVILMVGLITFIGGWFFHKFKSDKNQNYQNL
ncbi:hypothetical protein M0811_13994 [Anaeramoeba ignava]|uniref:Uncharacterized protein n=1 Tax=Anaeramoeba ignava TaxID=1746090 RepID=A0A9Q0RJ76_ANAIG|nr:hypothetical protein M0811_13994 [Anaeramoeba ignava]